MLRILPIFIAVAIWVYALVDCVRTPDEEMPYRVPKVVWIILVVVFPVVGAVAWIIVSRMARSQNDGGAGRSGRANPGGRPSAPSGPVAPDDDPEFLFRIEQRRRREAAEERRRQEQQRGKGDGDSAPDEAPGGATGTGATGSDGSPEAKPGDGGTPDEGDNKR